MFFLTWQNEQGLQFRYKYRRQFMFWLQQQIKHNQSTMRDESSTCDTDQISWPLLAFSSVAEDTGRCREVIKEFKMPLQRLKRERQKAIGYD